ncbi:hypothetical protein pb186bvf_007697 [Paramecium bursaria]
MILCLKRFIRKQKIRTQIYIFTSTMMILIFLFYILLVSQLTSQFSNFLQNELLQKIIGKNFQTQIDSIMGQILEIGKLEYVQLFIEDNSLQSLYKFVKQNSITNYYDLQTCDELTQILPSNQRQFCDKYYQIQNSDQQSRATQEYVKIQNQFIPFTKLSSVQTYYAFTLDSQGYVAYYKDGEQISLNEHILQVRDIMKKSMIPVYIQPNLLNGQYMTEVFAMISNNTVIGKSFKQGNAIYSQLLNNKKMIELKYYFITSEGEIIANSLNTSLNGKYFYEKNIQGFNQQQFERIFNQSLVYPGNNCGLKYQQTVFCVDDSNNQSQLIFSKFITTTELILIILDQQQLREIEIQFQDELNFIIDSTIKFNLYILVVVLVVSLIIQYIMIHLLNRPLVQLQQIAQNQISNNLLRIYNFVRLDKQQSQIQKLCDAYYNLININQKIIRRIPLEYKTTIHNQYSQYGLICNRYYQQQPIFKLYRQIKDEQ